MILQGDVREVAQTLDDQSINCIVTSPPYWGLRDYGTGEWSGGSGECEHVRRLRHTSNEGSTLRGGGGMLSSEVGSNQKLYYNSHCPKCGATRQDKQLGQEPTPEAYVAELVGVFRELRRVLRDDGTLWLNLGDSYFGSWGNYSGGGTGQRAKSEDKYERPAYKDTNARPAASFPLPGLKPKDLVGIPWLVAFALRQDGWYLRSDIIWHKPNPMPESVQDRPTSAHEHIFLLSKNKRYYYDGDAIREKASYDGRKDTIMKGSIKTPFRPNANLNTLETKGGERWPKSENGVKLRNARNVFTIPTSGYPEAHFACFPPDLIKPCILAGCPPDGTVLDPFGGSGTVAAVCVELGRKYQLIELNSEYIKLALRRIAKAQPALFAQVGQSWNTNGGA